MSRKKKEAALALLKARDLEGIVDWALDQRGAFRTLNSLAFDMDELVGWRAIEAIGKVAARKAEDDIEMIRDLVRRQFWTMTEESGGTAWRAPEIIGEVLANVPELSKEFGRLLAPLFHEEPFERGACWAVARAARANPEPYMDILDELVALFTSKDHYMRYYAVEALIIIDKQDLLDLDVLGEASSADGPVRTYDFSTGQVTEARLELPVK